MPTLDSLSRSIESAEMKVNILENQYNQMIADIESTFKGSSELLDGMKAMASVIWGRDTINEKLAEIKKLLQPAAEDKRILSKAEELILALEDDLGKKASFFTTYFQEKEPASAEAKTPCSPDNL